MGEEVYSEREIEALGRRHHSGQGMTWGVILLPYTQRKGLWTAQLPMREGEAARPPAPAADDGTRLWLGALFSGCTQRGCASALPR